MGKQRLKWWLPIVFAACATGCKTAPTPLAPMAVASDDPEVEALFRQARDRFDQGDLTAADASFAQLIGEHPSDPLAEPATIYRARIALLQDNPGRARELLAPLAGSTSPLAERAAFYNGVAAQAMGRHAEAIETLKRFVDRLTDPTENILLFETLWQASSAVGDTTQTITWLDRLLTQPLTATRREAIHNALADACATIDAPADLLAIKPLLDPQQSAWPVVMARLMALYFEAGQLELAGRIVAEVKEEGLSDHPSITDIASLIERRSAVDATTIGCIVPLSGRTRLIGEAVLKGVMLGSQGDPRSGGRNRLNVTIRDSGGDPDRAVAAVEELVLEEQVIAIIGPVDVSTAIPAAERANELGVPMLSLTVKDGVPQTGRFIFRQFSTSNAEVRSLVESALANGAQRFAMLYPQNGYGQTMHRLFSEVLAQRELPLEIAIPYDASSRSFTAEATQLAEAEFDTLFIPDQASRLVLIAPALAAVGVWSGFEGDEPPGPGRNVRLLIPSIGIAPDLIRRGGRYLQGAMFSTFFYPDDMGQMADFAKRFHIEYNRPPSYLAAFGHDAAALIGTAIRSGTTTRDGIRRWLSATAEPQSPTLSLVTPFDGFTPEGEPRALPHVLQLIQNRFEVLR